MLSATLLAIIEEACGGVMTLTEEVSSEEFFRSRLTIGETLRQLTAIRHAAMALPLETQNRMTEIDWPMWRDLAVYADTPVAPGAHEALWFAVRSLVPATLMWLRVYREEDPSLFAFRPADTAADTSA